MSKGRPDDSVKRGSKNSPALTAATEIVSLLLLSAAFHRTGNAIPSESRADVSMELNLGMHWERKDVLAVRLSAAIEQADVLRALIVFQGAFKPTGETEPEQPDKFWHAVATRLAPQVLYPFLRETFASLAQKSGVPHAILPVINIGSVFANEDFDLKKIPPPGQPA